MPVCGDFRSFSLSCVRWFASKASRQYGSELNYFLPNGRHPLQDLFERVISAPDDIITINYLESDLNRLDPSIRKEITAKLWYPVQMAENGDLSFEEYQWIEEKANIIAAIHEFALARLEMLSPDRRNLVYEAIWKIGGRPQIDSWGEIHAKEDTGRLIRALHREGVFGDGQGLKIKYLSTEEKRSYQSRIYELGLPELPKGRIGYINGMTTMFCAAESVARNLSEKCAGGVNFHNVHSETYGKWNDLLGAVIGQNAIPTKAVRLLHDTWQAFFEERPESEKFLQVCHSRGCIDTYNALRLLPEHLRQRIVVLSLAPAYIITSDLCFQALNAVILKDSIIRYAPNHHIIWESSDVVILPEQSRHPHDIMGDSYIEFTRFQIQSFIDYGRLIS